jgi:hypothetical protein
LAYGHTGDYGGCHGGRTEGFAEGGGLRRQVLYPVQTEDVAGADSQRLQNRGVRATMKTWIGRILVVFAIFTLGYGLGKDAGLNRAGAAAAGDSPVAQTTAKEDKIAIYYLHTTFRCITCSTIERIAHDTVNKELAALLESGKVEWHTINFQENPALAKRYEVASSAVVVVKIEAGKETAYRRLDEAWTLYNRPDEFSALIVSVVSGYLKEMER